jgi:endonuclease I
MLQERKRKDIQLCPRRAVDLEEDARTPVYNKHEGKLSNANEAVFGSRILPVWKYQKVSEKTAESQVYRGVGSDLHL